MSKEWWKIYSCRNLYQILLNCCRRVQQILRERMLSRAVKFAFFNDFDDELLKAVHRLWLTSVLKKVVYGWRLLQDRLPNRLDCEDSLWTFLDTIPQTFNPGQMFTFLLTDTMAETSQHPTFSFNIPGFCIIIFYPSGDEC